MIPMILGRKVGMTQIFDDKGNIVPVTVLEAGPCQVVQVKTETNDGYNAVQIGFAEKKKNVAKPQQGHFDKAGVTPKRFVREVRLKTPSDLKAGAAVTCEIFKAGDKVDVSGVTKGRGFAGTIKRHGFTRGPETHGSMNVRAPGSMGSNTYPGRVFKGKRLGGHMGNANSTQRSLVVVRVDAAKNLLLVRGPVPGPTGGYLKIRQAKYKR